MSHGSRSTTGDNYSPRSGAYGIVPREIAEDRSLGKGALRTYIALRCYTNKSGKAWPAVGTLAAVLGTDRRNVQRWLRELEQAGHIRREAHIREKVGGYGSNTYTALGLVDATDRAEESVRPPAVESTATHAVEPTAPHAVKSTALTDQLNGSSERSSITTLRDASESTASRSNYSAQVKAAAEELTRWMPVLMALQEQQRYEKEDAKQIVRGLKDAGYTPNLPLCLEDAHLFAPRHTMEKTDA